MALTSHNGHLVNFTMRRLVSTINHLHDLRIAGIYLGSFHECHALNFGGFGVTFCNIDATGSEDPSSALVAVLSTRG